MKTLIRLFYFLQLKDALALDAVVQQQSVATEVAGGTGMEFGCYGPVCWWHKSYAPAICACVIDGQIGVDQDTMMMWSTMPTTYKCVFFFFSN